MAFSYLGVVKQLNAIRSAMDGLPAGLNKGEWLKIIKKRKEQNTRYGRISPRYPWSALPAEPQELTNYIGGLDDIVQ
jgi:hypothetical protein